MGRRKGKSQSNKDGRNGKKDKVFYFCVNDSTPSGSLDL